MAIQLINPTDDYRWDAFLEEHPSSSIYHHSLWKLLIESTFKRLHPYYIASFNKNNEICGVLPSFVSDKLFSKKYIISLPLASHCDPLFYSNDEMCQSLNDIIKKCEIEDIQFIEIDCLKKHTPLEDLQFKELKYYVTHILNIDKNLEELRNSFQKSSIRRRVDQSLNSSLSLTLGKDVNHVKVFYHLETLNRKKFGLPPLPYAFFKNMWDIFYPKGLLSILLVKYKDQYISGIILLKYKKYVYYEYSAADQRFLKLHPNHFAIWKAIKLAREEGYSYFDFGRSSIDNDGLITFKKRWGAEENQLHYYYYPSLQSISAESRNSLKFRITKSVCKKMPNQILQALGEFSYRYMS